MNDAIIPAVFSGVRVVEGNYSEEGGLLVVGAGRTVLEITLENSRNTEYPLEILGADRDLVETPPEFDGRTLIRLALECPENGDERILDITLHLGQPPGRAQPADYRLPLKYALERIQFFHIIPDALSGPVTKLVLVLDKEIPGLSPDDISVTADGGVPFQPDSLDWVSDGICEIGIKEITPAKSIAVEIAPAGYRRESLSVDVNADPAPGEIQFLYAGAHDSNGTTEKLTLVFNQDVPGGLLSSDIPITRQGGGSPQVTVDGNPVRKAAGIYELAVIVTESGTVDVAVAKGGYSIVPGSLPVEVRYVVPVTFVSVTADGSDIADTTKLTLKFDRDIAGLAEGGITLDEGSTGAVPGTLAKTATGIYELALTGIKAAGTVRVTVRKDGYHFEPESRSAEAHYVVPVEFKDVKADGLATTAKLTLEFNKDIAGLEADDITLTDTENTGAKKKELYKIAGVEGKYTLELEGITAAGAVKVTVHKDGYHIVPEFLSVNVHYVVPVEFKSVTVSTTIANGKLVPYPSEAKAGDVVKVYLYPNDTYVYKEDSLKLDGYTGDPGFQKQLDGTFTFTMPNEDVVLTAQFFQPEAKLAVGGNVQYFETLKDAFTAVSTGAATITVLKDITVSEEIAVEGTVTVTLVAADGPIKTVKRRSSFKDSLFTVEAGASLTLGAGNSLGLAVDGDKGSVTATAALVKVSGGKLEMGERVKLKNNKRDDTNGSGSGVSVVSGGTFVMNGGEISGNTGPMHGGGVNVEGTFEMSGGTISGNTAGWAGGVRVSNGTFKMSGGEISNNNASNGTDSNGGGVFVGNNGVFEMGGGTISGNTATTNGSGVYVDDKTSTRFTLSGTAVVKQDVYLESGQKITVSGALTAAATKSTSIKLASATDGTEVVKGADSYSLTADDIAKFTLLGGVDTFILLNNNKGILADTAGKTDDALYFIGDTLAYASTLAEAISSIGTQTATVYIVQDEITVASNISVSGNITLAVPGDGEKTVERGSSFTDGSLFTVNGPGASLTLDAGNGSLTLDGGAKATPALTVNAALVEVSEGKLTMGDGVKLQNNDGGTSGGGGVSVKGSGVFEMTGGEISGNNTSYNKGEDYGGGGILVIGGTFTMSGGTICGNTATNIGGGGVFVGFVGTFTMEGGTISGNTGGTWGGGGVKVSKSGTVFYMNGGEISNNTAPGGGGVYVDGQGKFIMNDGTISDNEATSSDGGGVFIGNSGSVFTMNGGTITGNTAGGSGDNVCASGGTTSNVSTTNDPVVKQ